MIKLPFLGTPTDCRWRCRALAELPGGFYVWLASPEAAFLNRKFVWTNWDAQELLERADEIKSTTLLNWTIDGLPM